MNPEDPEPQLVPPGDRHSTISVEPVATVDQVQPLHPPKWIEDVATRQCTRARKDRTAAHTTAKVANDAQHEPDGLGTTVPEKKWVPQRSKVITPDRAAIAPIDENW